MKLLSITWSYQDSIDLSNCFLYKSFIKHNDSNNFINIHFNRKNFIELEKEFQERYGYQYEFLLYRIFLAMDKINNLEDGYYIISDTSDVVCLGNINEIIPPTEIMFSSEAHRYPWNCPDWKFDYSDIEKQNRNFLNGGLSIGKRDWYVNLFKSIINNIFPLNFKTFGGDQGVFTYHYLSNNEPKIFLDKHNNLFLSTYCRSEREYVGKKLPMFVHDNGWNCGSPRFIEKFNLIS